MKNQLNKKETIKKKIELRHQKLNFIEKHIPVDKLKVNQTNKLMNERDRLRIFGKPNVNPLAKSSAPILEQKIPISIIIPTWQAQNFIEQCLDSIENQTYFKDNNNFEVLIGVDACQDTLNKLIEIKNKYRNLSIFMMKFNMGTYVTTNTLLDLVKNENIIRFDSDDVMMPEMINEIMHHVNDYEIIQFGYSDFDNRVENAYRGFSSVALGAIFYKKSVFERAGGYQNWVCSADGELLFRMKEHAKFGNINKPLFFRRIHPNSLGRKVNIAIRNELKNKYKSLGETYKNLENVKINKVVNEYTLIESPYDYNICVVITTFNRENFVKRLLDNINKNKNDYKILIVVFDDASENSLNLIDYDLKYIRYYNNHGKKYYWQLITDTMQFCENINSKYFIYLPDDVTLVDDFFIKSIKLYESIEEENKICLSLLLPTQQIGNSNWTNFKPIEYDDYYKTQWCDLCFISEKKLFEALQYKIDEIPLTRWSKGNENLSSGVGRNLSKRLYDEDYNMYHVKSSLVLHSDHESVMHYNLRKGEKLTT